MGRGVPERDRHAEHPNDTRAQGAGPWAYAWKRARPGEGLPATVCATSEGAAMTGVAGDGTSVTGYGYSLALFSSGVKPRTKYQGMQLGSFHLRFTYGMLKSGANTESARPRVAAGRLALFCHAPKCGGCGAGWVWSAERYTPARLRSSSVLVVWRVVGVWPASGSTRSWIVSMIHSGCGKKASSSSAAGVIQLRAPTTTTGPSR